MDIFDKIAADQPVDIFQRIQLSEALKPPKEVFKPDQGRPVPKTAVSTIAPQTIQLDKDFDPEGSGYDIQTAQRLIEKYPLTTPKPDKYIGQVVANEGAFEAWYWNPKLKDYERHQASRDPETGLLLKGRKYPTWNLTEEGEEKAGYRIYKGKNGRYYSRKRDIFTRIFEGTAEAAGTIVGNLTGAAAGGVVGLYDLAVNRDLDHAVGAIEAVAKEFALEPKSKEGKKILKTAEVPFELLHKAAQKSGDYVLEKTGNPEAATTVYTAIDTLPFWFFPAFAKIKSSGAYRKLTVRERGLVVQSLDETIRNNPKMTEGELLKRWNNPTWRKEALAKRVVPEMKTEAPPPVPPRVMPVTKYKTKPEKISEAVGKPEQVDTLQKMGKVTEKEQIEAIVQDAVEQPKKLAEIAKSQGKEQIAEKLETKAQQAGAIIKSADGDIADAAVDRALKPDIFDKIVGKEKTVQPPAKAPKEAKRGPVEDLSPYANAYTENKVRTVKFYGMKNDKPAYVKKAVIETIEAHIKQVKKAEATSPVFAADELYVEFHDPHGTVFTVRNTSEALTKFKQEYGKITTTGKKKLYTTPSNKPSKPVEAIGELIPIEGEKNWITDGHILIISPKPKGTKGTDRTPISKDALTQFKEYAKSDTVKPAELRYYTTGTPDVGYGLSKEPVISVTAETPKEAKTEPRAIFKAGPLRYAYQQSSITFILNRYPKAKFKINTQKGRNFLFAYDGNKLVSILAPLDITRQSEIPNVKEAIKAGYYSMGDYSEIPAIMEMPEVVELAKGLLDGKYPELIKKFRKAGVMGAFYPGSGKIKLRRDLAVDMSQALKTLAHEIGHLIDWLPDKNMARGNILGRIASLKGYMKKYLAEKPGAPGPLTEADRARLRKEARILANKDAEELIDEVIKKEVPVSPDEVLAILKGLDYEPEPSPALVHFIFTASTAVKKSVAVQAMKGLTPKEVEHLKNTIEVKTGRKIAQAKPTEKQIYAKYKKLVEAEIAKRNLFNHEEIMNELKAHTEVWRPFVPYTNLKYTKYRYSSPELYADAISALIAAPATLKRTAPKFWEGFFNYIEEKPEVKKIWDEIQAIQKRGPAAVSEHRIEHDYEMFKRGHELRHESYLRGRKKGEKILDTLGRGLWDRNHAILKQIRKLEKQGGKIAGRARSTRYDLEEIQYLAAEIDDFLNEYHERIQKPLDAAGISTDDLGIYMLRKHIEKNREGIFSPKGYTSESVKQDLNHLEQKWGKDKFNRVKNLAEEYRKLREERIIPLLEESGLASPELIKVINDRIYYSKVSVLKYLEDKYGTGTSGRIFKQLGTLQDVENPLVATMLQDISLVRAARINMTKRGLVKNLKEARVIEPAELKYSQDIKGMKPVDHKDPDISILSVMVNGKPKHYYVSKPIAESFKYNPYEATQIATFWHYLSQPIREILVTKNPLWMTRNVIRDFRETYKKIPEIKLRHTPLLALKYAKAWPEVWSEIMKKGRSKDIKTMMQSRMLTPDRVWQAKEINFEDELVRLQENFNLSVSADKQSISAQNKIKRFWNYLDKLGRGSDVWGKVAGYKYLKQYSGRPEKEIGHVVRSRIGTPDIYRRGEWQLFTNNVFMFSNVNKEGKRAHFESFREDPGAYIWKTIATNMISKALLAAAAAGAFGLYIKKMVDGISEYDKANYDNIPLYLWKGKTVYLRIPQDYEGQFFGALVWKLMNMKLTGLDGAVSTIEQQNPYQWHPLIEVGLRLGDYYLRGHNPTDSYRGRYLLSDRVFEVGGLEAAEQLGKYAWKNLGLSVLYNPTYDDIKRERTVVEEVLRTFPGNVLGTFLKISDQGILEQGREKFHELRKEKAKASLALDKELMKLEPAEKMLVYLSGNSQLKRKIRKFMLQEQGTAFAKLLSEARSEEEMNIVIQMMLEQTQFQEN